MKKFKFIACAIAATLALVGCGNKKDLPAGELPKGGTAIDVSTEQGKADLYDNVSKVVNALSETEFNAIGLKSETKNLNLDVNADVVEDGGNIKVEASLHKAGVTLEAKVKGDKEAWYGQASISGLKGELAAKVNAPIEETTLNIDEKLSFKDVGADLYLKNNTLYGDVSGKGLRNLLTDAQPIVKRVLKQIPQIPAGMSIDLNELVDQMTGEARKFYVPNIEMSNFNLFALLDGMEPELPTAEEWAQAAAVIEQLPFLSFETYKDGRFGIAAHVTKEGIMKLEETFEDMNLEGFDKVVDSLDVKAAVMFKANGMVDFLSLGGNAKIVIDEPAETEGGDSTHVEVTLGLEEKLSLTINDEVKMSMPSDEELAKYVQFQVPEMFK